MADGEDAAVNPVQRTAGQQPVDHAIAKPRRTKLRPGRDTTLTGGDAPGHGERASPAANVPLSALQSKSGAFAPHIGDNLLLWRCGTKRGALSARGIHAL